MEENKEYLLSMIDALEIIHLNDQVASYYIRSVKEKGFQVQMKGIFGFVPFNKMPWNYPNINYWQQVGNSLIGKQLKGKIFSFQKNPIQLKIDGTCHVFKPFELTEGATYSGIIVNKTLYGAFIEVGCHFNWKYGSIMGLVHQTNFNALEEYEALFTGATTAVYYYGKNEQNKLEFGFVPPEKRQFKINKQDFINSYQIAHFYLDDAGHRAIQLESGIKAKWLINKKFHPNTNRVLLKKIRAQIPLNQPFPCTVIAISKKGILLIAPLDAFLKENFDY